MPLVDKPLSELQDYQGINPRPADFDEYWNEGLAEMEALDPKVELIPAQFQAPFAECFDLYFTGVGGSRVYAKYLAPRGAENAPAILNFHGYRGHSGDWMEKLAFPAAGFAIAAMDCRGQGGKSEDLGGARGSTYEGHIVRGLGDADPKRLAFRQIFLDTALLAKIVAGFREVDAGRMGAYGESQGGALTLACAALAPHRIKRAAPTFPFLSDYKRVWEMDQAKDAYAELRYFFRMFDPRHEREHEIFTRLGYVDVQHLAARIRGEVLMGTGLMDTVCPPSTQFAAYNKITSKKHMEIYPDFAHELLPGFRDKVFRFLTEL